MAKRKKQQDEKSEIVIKSDYPIKLLLLVNLLIASLLFLWMVIFASLDTFTAFFRAFLIFTLLSFLGGIALWVVVSIGVKVREQKMQEEFQRLEQQQREFLQTQLDLQKELADLEEDKWTFEEEESGTEGQESK